MSKRARMLALLATATAVVVGGVAINGTPKAASAVPPAPPGVTKADVVTYLRGISGRNVLSGQQGGANNNPGQWLQTVRNITGQYPGVWGGDFGFSQNDIDNRQTVINQARTEWANGTLPELTWHMCRPDVATCNFEGGANPVKGSRLSASEWQQIVTNGTTLNNTLKNRLEQTVPYFLQLQAAGIPVMFRPYHEMNEGWAWWGGAGGANGSARLYQITRDYLQSRGLNNIVWVWALKDVGGNGPAQAASYYPGNNYVDVVGLDVWVSKFPSTAWYQAMQNIAGTKPMALAEVGAVPQPSQMAAQPKWTYWKVWLDWLLMRDYNPTDDYIRAGYNDGRTFNQGEIRIPIGNQPTPTPTTPPGGSRTGPITGAGGRCADIPGAATTNGLQVQIWTCNGTGAQAWTVASDGTVRALGKCLDVNGGINANGTSVQIWDCIAGSPNQQWAHNSTSRQLTNPTTGKCLDATGQGTADGTKLQIWTCNTQPNQQWTLPA